MSEIGFMAISNMKKQFYTHETAWTSGRARTAKEATQLLEELRAAYQSLPAKQRGEVKDLMSSLQESQRRFGSTCMAWGASWTDKRICG
jgi:hypothetical protein